MLLKHPKNPTDRFAPHENAQRMKEGNVSDNRHRPYDYVLYNIITRSRSE